MRTALYSILKNLALLAVLAVSLVYIFSIYMVRHEFFIAFAICSALYILICFLEAHNHKKLAVDASKTYRYYTASAISKYLIKIFIFIMIGIVLCFPSQRIQYLAWFCFMVAAVDLLVMLYKRLAGILYIYLGEDHLIVCTTKPYMVHSANIQQINTRHGLLYILKKNKDALTLRVDVMRDGKRFMQDIQAWSQSHAIPFVAEP